jgi:YfiH family protein
MVKIFQQADQLIEKQKDGLTVFEFPGIASFADVQHGVFTRKGGCSRGAYCSLNVSFGIGDNTEAVVKNRKRISAYFNDGSLVFSEQVHGTDVCAVGHTHGFCGKTHFIDAGTGDAIITNVPGLNLVIQVADCQAVMIYDPGNHAVANIHAGWRGNVQNIIGAALDVMKERYHSDPADLKAGISPSLGPCCAEFINYQREFPEHLWRYKDSSHHFDLWALSHDQLCAQGVLPKNISIGGLCTTCHSETFFSYRARKKTGRFAAVIGLT